MRHYRWVIIAFTFVAVIITYLDRSALSYVIGPLEMQFKLNNTEFGLISSAFGLGYLIITVRGGMLVDRYGPRFTWSVSAIFWSIACASIGLAMGFAWLFVFRLLLGLAEGPSFPALTRVSADWLPVKERARSLAFGLAAVPFASVVGAPLIAFLSSTFGWRLMFLILGLLGVIWAISWIIVFRDKPDQCKHVSPTELAYIENNLEILTPKKPSEIENKTTWRFILFNPTFLANNYAFFSFGYLLFFAITWLPGYLEQTYSLKLKETAIYLIAPWLTATILVLLGGWISDYLWSKTKSIRISRSHVIWICQVLSAVSFIPAILFDSLPIEILSLSLGLGFGMMPNAAFYLINTDLARDRSGTSLGVMNSAFAAGGVLAPLLTGLLSSLTGDFSAALGLLVVLTFSSALGIIIFQHPDEVLAKKWSQ